MVPISPTNTPKVSLVIPTLNEADNLPLLAEKIPEIVDEIVVVDGRSVDDTIEVARRLWPTALILLERRAGKGRALASGFDAATGDIIVMIDADDSMNPLEINSFVRLLRDGADFVKGSRYLDHGGSSDLTRIRSFGNQALTKTVNLLFGTSYTDLCYGYNAFWRHCLPCLDVDCAGFEVETLMNIRVAKAGLRVAEAPSFESHRAFGESNLNAISDGLRIAGTIIRESTGRTRTMTDADRRAADENNLGRRWDDTQATNNGSTDRDAHAPLRRTA